MANLSFLPIGIPASGRLVFRPIYPQEAIIPLPTVNYQGDGYTKKKRRKKRDTQELFDRIECSLLDAIYGREPSTATCDPIATRHIDTEIYRLQELSVGYSDLIKRLEKIKLQFEIVKARRDSEIEDDDEEFLLM